MQDIHADIRQDIWETNVILKWQLEVTLTKKIVIEKVKKLAGILMSQEMLGMRRSLQGKQERSEKKAMPWRSETIFIIKRTV